MTPMMVPVSGEAVPAVGVIGCGYWGANLVRNLSRTGALSAVCDRDPDVATSMSDSYGVPARSFDELLSDATINAVAIATPAREHATLAHRAIEAQKHVFVEKPLAPRVHEAESLCTLADELDRVLMVGHLLRYHPAFLELQELVSAGKVGRIQYVYSNRLNLGKIRREEDILWSFAPHDISMILALVGAEPESVSAVGARYLHKSIADVTTTHLAFPGGEQAHVFVSWLHPHKEHRLVVVGDSGMLVFDDGEPWESKLKLYRHRVEWRDGAPLPVKAPPEPIAVQAAEPLDLELRHFCRCVTEGGRPRTDGREGVRVLRVLELASASMERVSLGAVTMEETPLPVVSSDVFVHPSCFVDADCEVGAGTRIWHFCHIAPRSRIGRNCTIGQNVMVGPDVTIGDNCKIQNNVSVYSGVTLDDDVFCGPSCVFTNVKNPRAEIDRKNEFLETRVGKGATVGANATIVGGHEIGAYAFIAAGAVVTTDAAPHALMAGVPAGQVGWVSHDGERLGDDLVCPRSGQRYVITRANQLQPVDDPSPTTR